MSREDKRLVFLIGLYFAALILWLVVNDLTWKPIAFSDSF